MFNLRKSLSTAAFMLVFAIPCLPDQPSVPSDYTLSQVTRLTEASMFSGQQSNLKVYRSGSKELIELKIAPWPANDKGVHYRYLFDFESHRAYTQDLVNNSCSWMTYVSSRAPIRYDPITGVDAQSKAEMAKAKQNPVGTETVHGIPAVIVEADTPDGKMRTWIAQKGDFPVKMAIKNKSGALITLMEVTQVDFNRPAASLFVPPAGCSTQTQGEWSDTGVSARAGAQVSAQASASANLATGGKQAQVSARSQQGAGSSSTSAGGADEFVDNMDVTPSEGTCSVLFRVVRAGTMEPVVSGLQISVDNRDVSSQYKNGVVRISNAPPRFTIQIESSDGSGWASDISRQCYRPETVLMLTISRDFSDTHWYWVKSGKYATIQK